MSEDPLGFEAGDRNLRRYGGNFATGAVDPSGLESSEDRWNRLSQTQRDRLIRMRQASRDTEYLFFGGYAEDYRSHARDVRRDAIERLGLRAKDDELRLSAKSVERLLASVEGAALVRSLHPQLATSAASVPFQAYDGTVYRATFEWVSPGLGKEGFYFRLADVVPDHREPERYLYTRFIQSNKARNEAQVQVVANLGLAGGVVALSMIPGVGEAMDAYDVTAPDASLGQRATGGASLTGNLLLAGVAPNGSALRRGSMAMADASRASRLLREGTSNAEEVLAALRIMESTPETQRFHRLIELEASRKLESVAPNSAAARQTAATGSE